MDYKIERTNTENENFRVLVKRFDEELVQIYGEMQKRYAKNNIVMGLNAIVVYDGQTPIACGCLKFMDNNIAEVKRVFVTPESRGKGVSKILMHELEKWAIDCNINALILQTGQRQPTAINLYRSLGYVDIESYGIYVGDPNSNCMKKVLV